MQNLVNAKKKIAIFIIPQIFVVTKLAKYICAQRSIQDTAGTFGALIHAEMENQFHHRKDPSHTDAKNNDDLANKYDILLAQFKDLKNKYSAFDNEMENLKQQLHEQALEIHVLRGYTR